MRCKACNCPIEYTKKRALSLEDIPIPRNEAEDLCDGCLGVAKDCYSGYTIDTKTRESALERWCKSPIQDSELGDVMDSVQRNGYIEIEES